MIRDSNAEIALMDNACSISQNKAIERDLLQVVICIHPFLPMNVYTSSISQLKMVSTRPISASKQFMVCWNKRKECCW